VAAVLLRHDGKIPEAICYTYGKQPTATAWSPSQGGESGEKELTAVEFIHHAFSARERLCEKYQKEIVIQLKQKEATWFSLQMPTVLITETLPHTKMSSICRLMLLRRLDQCVNRSNSSASIFPLNVPLWMLSLLTRNRILKI
jgi:hypothetical protein